ncbi:hypothetical protein PTTG_29512 [Puccinia triticina 1-1 BBBD Race 1]|uniref:Uncharacterized protein n=1 Tax=Puccinia triticina (isolate 1-1 / race 1 (BBBD)) TaxID=630390 RepID=A0A180G3R8_PUCT1|nr:hypothetical protein PTTG_29512 [Puccinia triticina 1-1 BBBD Race 1]
MAETSQQSRDSNTNSAPQPRRGFEELESALPPLEEDFLEFPQEETLPPDTGIPPALYNSREKSLALALNRSTPVPRPVEREQMNLSDNFQTTNLQPPQPTCHKGLRPGTPPDLALHPFAPNQPPAQPPAEPHVPMEIIQEESKISSLSPGVPEREDHADYSLSSRNHVGLDRGVSRVGGFFTPMSGMDSSRRTERARTVSIQQTSNRPTPAANVRSSSRFDSSSYHNEHIFSAAPQPQASNSLSYAGAYATPTARPKIPGTYSSARTEGPAAAAAAAATSSYTPASFYTPRWEQSAAPPPISTYQRVLDFHISFTHFFPVSSL